MTEFASTTQSSPTARREPAHSLDRCTVWTREPQATSLSGYLPRPVSGDVGEVRCYTLLNRYPNYRDQLCHYGSISEFRSAHMKCATFLVSLVCFFADYHITVYVIYFWLFFPSNTLMGQASNREWIVDTLVGGSSSMNSLPPYVIKKILARADDNTEYKHQATLPHGSIYDF